MKNIIAIIFFLLPLAFVKAQAVKPYIAVVKTIKGKEKGILYKVDSAHVILNHNGEFIVVPVNEIKTVQIRTVKKGYKGLNLIKVGDDYPNQYQMGPNGKMIDKWGKEQPSLEDYASVTFFSVIFTAIGNAVALPIHAINPNVARFNFKQKDGNQLNELGYYSTYYQSNPDVLAELRKIKDISSKFKP